MNISEEFLSPKCTATTLDRFIVRSSILRCLREVLPRLHGTLLDVGCGQMPYKSLVSNPPSRITRYIGLDLLNNMYSINPDLTWDGQTIPLVDSAVECAMATEVFEHTPDPESVLREIQRVLKPGGLLFFTVPFLWPLHDVPFDEYRYTPFALERHLKCSGFEQIQLQALGGWDASLAQMIGLWVRRRSFSAGKRSLLSKLALPIVRHLAEHDRPPKEFTEGCMITGVSGSAIKPRE